jgi:hypothetical protein
VRPATSHGQDSRGGEQGSEKGSAADGQSSPSAQKAAPAPPRLPAPAGAKRLLEPDRVWVDAKNRQVLVDGSIALREGYLEMFACLVGTKEHESIVAAETKAATVHAALLAVGAMEGHPVQYKPEFQPPAGTEIAVEVRWLDAQGRWQSARAQDWILDVKTEKAMTQPWVFAGSSFLINGNTGERQYAAEQGDFICVSNFTSAMLDVPIASSDATDGLLFRAFTERIPPLKTPVRLVLTPALEGEAAGTGANTPRSEEASK